MLGVSSTDLHSVGPAVYATDLVEANVGGLLTEALTADVQAVLADETGLVGADTAVKEPMLASLLLALYSLSLLIFLLIAQHPPFLLQSSGVYTPFTAALAVGARARVPDRLVGHVDGWLSWVGERCFVGRGSEAVYSR